jgi:hypothetical protein
MLSQSRSPVSSIREFSAEKVSSAAVYVGLRYRFILAPKKNPVTCATGFLNCKV